MEKKYRFQHKHKNLDNYRDQGPPSPEHILAVVEKSNMNVTDFAKHLGISRHILYNAIHRINGRFLPAKYWSFFYMDLDKQKKEIKENVAIAEKAKQQKRMSDPALQSLL